MHGLKLSDLEFVFMVATKGTVSAAASELNVNHATVLRRIQAFEEKVNIRIFERLRTGYKLTAEGEVFLEAAQSVEEIVMDLQRKMAAGNQDMKGPLTITTTDGIFPVVAPLIGAFQKEFPDVETDTYIANAMLDLDSRAADIAIRASNNPSSHLVGRRITDVNFGIYAKQEIAEAFAGIPVEEKPWLGMRHPLDETPARKWMEVHIPASAIVMTSNSYIALRDFAAQGLGYALLPCHLGGAAVGLVRVPTEIRLPSVGLWLLSHRDVLRSRKVKVCSDYLFQALKTMKGQFQGEESQ